jgi:hypothetical protein
MNLRTSLFPMLAAIIAWAAAGCAAGQPRPSLKGLIAWKSL